MSKHQSSIASQYGAAADIPINIAIVRVQAYQRIVKASHAGETYQISPVFALSPGQLSELFTAKQLKNLIRPLGGAL